jgi:toxin secretion/phage lysis holin
MPKNILDNVATAAGATGKEAYSAGWIAAIATFATAYLGGWDVSLKLLAYLMLADLLTGFLGALKSKNINSETMFWGGIRKAVILLIVFLAVQFDQFTGISDDCDLFLRRT